MDHKKSNSGLCCPVGTRGTCPSRTMRASNGGELRLSTIRDGWFVLVTEKCEIEARKQVLTADGEDIPCSAQC